MLASLINRLQAIRGQRKYNGPQSNTRPRMRRRGRSLLIGAVILGVAVPHDPALAQLKDIWDILRDIYEMRQEALREERERQQRNLPRTNIATICWAYHSNSFIILGPNPEGERASKGYKWMPIVILFESDCRDTIHLNAQNFRLQEHNGPVLNRSYRPTTRGMQYQKDRLSSGWVKPGGERQGYLTFEVANPMYNREYGGHQRLAYTLHYDGLSDCHAFLKHY